MHQLVEDRDERLGRALEADHLARELVDAPRDVRAAVEDVVLDLVDVVLDAGDDRRVVVDDAVHDRVQDRDRAAAQEVGTRFESRRTRARSGASLWRTVITKCGPAKTWTSPNSTVSVSSM